MKIGVGLGRERPIPMPSAADWERFEDKVEWEPTSGCGLWTAAVMKNGYGVFGLGGRAGKQFLAHRVAYRHAKGPIPAGYEIDHLCRVRCCVNPAHLEAVPGDENMRRSVKASCRKGHFHIDSYFWHGQRYCRECRRQVTLNRRRSA